MAALTVFTPAYNRAHTLPRTYESLCSQSCKDFVWLIVDEALPTTPQSWSAPGRKRETNSRSATFIKRTAVCTPPIILPMRISTPS